MPAEGQVAVEDTQLRVQETGEILLNDDQVGDAADTKLMNLTATMVRLQESSKAAGSKVVVTIMADEQSQYQRVIDVLNALSLAQVENVTFEVPPQ